MEETYSKGERPEVRGSWRDETDGKRLTGGSSGTTGEGENKNRGLLGAGVGGRGPKNCCRFPRGVLGPWKNLRNAG